MKQCSSSDPVSSSLSTSAVSDQLHLATSSLTTEKSPSITATTAEGLAVGSRDAGGAQEKVTVDRRGEYSAVCRWTVLKFPRNKAKALWSKYFKVGGYDFRLLVYPKGDSQALPGYISIYLQIMDPRGTSSSKWDCFASYRLAIVNVMDDSKTIHRDSWHRFSSKKKSHGWCDFTSSFTVFDSKLGYLFNNDSVTITADILILNESVNFTRDNNEPQSMIASSSSVVTGPVSDVLSGKFTWKVGNFSLFKEIIKTQKIMSPVFPAGECNLRISVYQSSVNGVDYLSMCLESKETEKTILLSDTSCWCLFRMSVLNQKPGSNHMHRDSYGRFAAGNKRGDYTSLGWNDYMKMSDFVGDSGFLVDDMAVFSTSFHVIKESNSFSKNGGLITGRIGSGARKSDGHLGKLTWRIENFTRLKDLLKKRKITGLCIKSRRYQIGNQDCRLIIYPRGQSQPPCHLSMFLEVTDSGNTSSDWSCFVSHHLLVVNQRMEEKSVTKESQNRYSKAAKDWGWREFVTLTSLFDQDSGFLVQDSIVFSAEVLVLKETSIVQDFTDLETESVNASFQIEGAEKISSFTWKVENFLAFKEIMETRKIFSKFFQVGGCELRIGVYESFDTICIYLESDQSVGSDPDKNFWVRYRMAVVNQKNHAKTVWKESSICTKTWNNSVLQFMKVSDMLEADAGFLVRDNVVFVCEILDYCPWFEFSDLEVFASEDDQDAMATNPDELVDSEDDGEGISGDEEDIFRNLLSRAGFHLTYGDNPSKPQVTLREKLLMDSGAIAGFLTRLRVYLDDPAKVKRLLLPTKLSGTSDGKVTKTDDSSPSLMNLLMGVKVLQNAITDLLLDIMVECCQPTDRNFNANCSSLNLKFSPDRSEAACPLQSDKENGASVTDQFPTNERLDSGVNKSTSTSAVHSSEMNGDSMLGKGLPVEHICPPETSALVSENVSLRSKTRWLEQSEELLGLIVNSLRALDGAIPQGCPEPERRPQSAHKIAIVLDKAPKHLQPDLVALVPKLVEHSEHPLAAFSLLERLQKPNAEPSLRIPVFGSLNQLECESEVWERVLFRSFELLTDSNDEPLAATIEFIFKAASKCQQLPTAVRYVRAQLKVLGMDVSPCVLEFLSKSVNSWGDAAETILRDIDCDDNFSDTCPTMPCGLLVSGENGTSSERLHLLDDQAFQAGCHFSDIYFLVEMLSIPCLAVEASQIFERVVARDSTTAHSVALVLERILAQRLSLNARHVAKKFKHTEAVMGDEQLRVNVDDFTAVLGLADTLAISRDSHVRSFVKMLYPLLFKYYADESLRWKMLKRLIDRATSSIDNSGKVDLDLDILFTLACEEQEIIRPVLNMMWEVARLANVDRDAKGQQLCAIEDEITHLREEMKEEISNMANEKAVKLKKLIEVEDTNNRLKSKMMAEMDHFARERKELSEQKKEVVSQLEWICVEHNDEIKKLGAEKKALQDRLHDAEAQFSRFKSRKSDELKKLVNEKNALAERLKNAEAALKRFEEELKRYATENVTQEEIRQSLENEIRLLTHTVGQIEEEKREKEEQVARCQAFIDRMESQMQAFQQYIHTLKVSIQEEKSKNAPLFGEGLESLSMNDLEILTRIHEDRLRKIYALQQRNGNPAGHPVVNPHMLPHNHALCPAPPPPMAVGMPPSFIQNGVGIHDHRHLNGAIGPWFNHS